MTTSSPPVRSSFVKSRPATNGTPSTAKNPGVTTRMRAVRVLFAIRRRVALDGELTIGTSAAGIAPRHEVPERHALDARQLADPARHLLVELHLLRITDAERRRRQVDGQHLPHVETGARAVCRATSVTSSVPAPASSTNENAICVVAKTRRRRFVPGVMRTLPPGSPASEEPAEPRLPVDGRRGM